MISVIIPVYNIEEYIEDCVNSVIVQKYRDWECILVDDGSTDRSGHICDYLAKKDCRIRVIHQKNQGLSAARNSGLRNSMGRYVFFLDGDDLIRSDTLYNFYGMVSEFPVDVVWGHMAHFYGSEVPIPYTNIVRNEWVRGLTGKEAFVVMCKNLDVLMLGVRGLYNREFLLSNSLFFGEQNHFAEDQEWTIRLLLNTKKMLSNESCDYLYREGREGSIMNTIRVDKIEDALKVYDRWYEDVLKHNSDPFYVCLYQLMIKRLWEFYFKYPEILSKKDHSTFCSMMDVRRRYAERQPADVKKNLHMFVMNNLKSKYICALCTVWKKIHKQKILRKQ